MYIEPQADVRQATNLSRAIYNGYIESGFTEDQAFELIKIATAEMFKRLPGENGS